jgi:hypothetical protein
MPISRVRLWPALSAIRPPSNRRPPKVSV